MVVAGEIGDRPEAGGKDWRRLGANAEVEVLEGFGVYNQRQVAAGRRFRSRWPGGTGRAKSKKGNRYLGAILGETAVVAGRTQTREGARYRRLAHRRGKAKAQVAVGNTQLKVYHKLLSSPGARYEDLGPDYFDRRAGIRRQLAHHVGKLAALGFEVTLCRIPEPGPDPGQAA